MVWYVMPVHVCLLHWDSTHVHAGGIVVVRSVAPSISLLAMLVSSSFEMQAQCMPHDSSMHANGFVGANEKLMWSFP
jgi:hypothetical protein